MMSRTCICWGSMNKMPNTSKAGNFDELLFKGLYNLKRFLRLNVMKCNITEVYVMQTELLMKYIWDFTSFPEQDGNAATEEAKKSNHVQRKLEKRQEGCKIDSRIEEQFGGGLLLLQFHRDWPMWPC